MDEEFLKFQMMMKKFIKEKSTNKDFSSTSKISDPNDNNGKWDNEFKEKVEKATEKEKEKTSKWGKIKQDKQPKIQKKIEKTSTKKKGIKKQNSDTQTERFCSAITKTTGEECGAKIKDLKEEFCGRHTNYGDSSLSERVCSAIMKTTGEECGAKIKDQKQEFCGRHTNYQESHSENESNEDEALCSHFFENGKNCTYRATRDGFCGKHYNFGAFCGLYQCNRKLKASDIMFCSDCREKINSRL